MSIHPLGPPSGSPLWHSCDSSSIKNILILPAQKGWTVCKVSEIYPSICPRWQEHYVRGWSPKGNYRGSSLTLNMFTCRKYQAKNQGTLVNRNSPALFSARHYRECQWWIQGRAPGPPSLIFRPN